MRSRLPRSARLSAAARRVTIRESSDPLIADHQRVITAFMQQAQAAADQAHFPADAPGASIMEKTSREKKRREQAKIRHQRPKG